MLIGNLFTTKDNPIHPIISRPLPTNVVRFGKQMPSVILVAQSIFFRDGIADLDCGVRELILEYFQPHRVDHGASVGDSNPSPRRRMPQENSVPWPRGSGESIWRCIGKSV